MHGQQNIKSCSYSSVGRCFIWLI